MPRWLEKDYGPFSGTIWAVVIVGGVGLGLLMRRFMVAKGDTAAAVATDPAYAGIAPGAPFASGGGTLYNQGEIVSGVLEAIEAQKPPPAETVPEVEVTTDPIIVAIDKVITAIDKVSNQPAPAPVIVSAPAPAPKRSYVPLNPDNIRALFRDYPGAFIGDAEYWVQGHQGTGIPGVTAARPEEWPDFWAAYNRAGL